MTKTKIYGSIICAIAVFGLGAGLGRSCSSDKITVAPEETKIPEIIAVDLSETVTLRDEIKRLKEENSELLKSVKKSQVRSVVRVTAESPEPTVIFQSKFIPDHYSYKIGDVTIAEFDAEENEGYRFTTHKIMIGGTVLVGSDTSSSQITMSSDYGDQTVILPSTLEVTKIKERVRVIDPQVQLGVYTEIPLDVGGLVSIPFIHPTNDIDILSPTVLVGENLSFGIQGISYNVGKPIPILTNVWTSAGASMDLDGKVSGFLSIGAKL